MAPAEVIPPLSPFLFKPFLVAAHENEFAHSSCNSTGTSIIPLPLAGLAQAALYSQVHPGAAQSALHLL